MGICYSRDNHHHEEDDSVIEWLRTSRERSLHDHLVVERSSTHNGGLVMWSDDSYEFVRILHQGTYSQMVLVTKKQTQEQDQQQRNIASGNVQYVVKMYDANAAAMTVAAAVANQDGINTCTTTGTSNNNNNNAYYYNVQREFSKRKFIGQEDVVMEVATKQQKKSRKQTHHHRHHPLHVLLRREAAMLMECDHPHIIKLYECIKATALTTAAPISAITTTTSLSSLVLEYCHGGTLESYLPYTDERLIARILRQILEALAYLHRKHIVHRDIHMSNIVFQIPPPPTTTGTASTTTTTSNTNHFHDVCIKLIDFGSATILGRSSTPSAAQQQQQQQQQRLPHYTSLQYLKEKVGTLETMAPDVIKGKYTNKADIWSTGIVAYQLFQHGKTPFSESAPTPQQLEDQILKGYISFRGWNGSSRAKEWVQHCLALNPGYRPTAAQALEHDFIGKKTPAAATTTTSTSSVTPAIASTNKTKSISSIMSPPTPSSRSPFIPNRLVVSFQLYQQSSPLKRAAWNVLARKLPLSNYYDPSFHHQDGEKHQHPTPDQPNNNGNYLSTLRQLFCDLDIYQTGTLTREEFLQGFKSCGFDHDELVHLFDIMDINGNDEILFTEFLAAALGTHVQQWTDAQLREAFNLLDESQSGFITTNNLIKVLGNTPKLRNYLMKTTTTTTTDDLCDKHSLAVPAQVTFEEFRELFHNTTTTPYHFVTTTRGTIMETLEESSEIAEDGTTN